MINLLPVSFILFTNIKGIIMNHKSYMLLLFSPLFTIVFNNCMDGIERNSNYKTNVQRAQRKIGQASVPWITYGEKDRYEIRIEKLKSYLAKIVPKIDHHKDALFDALNTRNHSQLTSLLFDNADPNVYDEKNTPLLMKALFEKDLTSLIIILSTPTINPNLPRKAYKDESSSYDTPLRYAIANDQLEATILLCKAGAHTHEGTTSFTSFCENACSQYVLKFK